MNPEPNEDQLRAVLGHAPVPEPDTRWVSALEQRVTARAVELHHRKNRMRWSSLSRWLASGAAVAACVAFVMIMLFSGSEVTFAAVQERIQQADSMSFRTSVELIAGETSFPLGEIRSWTDLTLGVRTDVSVFGDPVAQVILPSDGQPLFVDHVHRRFTPIELPPKLDPERLRRLDPTSLVRRFGDIVGDIKPIRQVEADSDAEIGFRIDGDALGLPESSSVDLWVDRESQLPIKVVCTVPLNDRQTLRLTADRFIWQELINPELFFSDAPTGYASFPVLKVPDPNEQVMIRMLRQCARLSGGTFPSSDLASWPALAQMALASQKTPSSPSRLNGEQQRVLIGDLIAGVYYFLHLHDQGAEPRYTGTGVRLGNADQVLIRWHLRDGNTRVVYGDLSMETIEP